MSARNTFERNFRVISYLVALSGLFALFASGGVGIIVFAVFVGVTLFAWVLEDTKWQLSERVAVAIIFAGLIGFFLDWKFQITGIWSDGIFAAAGLSRLILLFAAIKLLQKKADKDWIFIYVISFFEVLLAAGLSISPLYLLSLFLYLLFATCAVVAFEIRKSSRIEGPAGNSKLETGIKRINDDSAMTSPAPAFKIPIAAVVLLAAITLIGLPIFFAVPRGNAAGFGSDFSNPVNVTGFSESVTLGTIGTLQKNDSIVMRVRIDQNNNEKLDRLLWRGVALDEFDHHRWKKSDTRYSLPIESQRRNFVSFDYPAKTGRITIQTFYLEPMNTNVLFALRQPFAISGLEHVNRDAEGALLRTQTNGERISYSVYSDTSIPPLSKLRADNTAYPAHFAKYLQKPDKLDPRIGELARKYIDEAKAVNRYDSVSAIEKRLQNDYAYSLDMKAGGNQPVADFLFNVRKGHCEYFASSMAMMLRSQGIAARIVNGFQSGEYNETAGVYVVRQYSAHSWVEVYFPVSDSWIAFDPTPVDGRPGGANSGFFGSISRLIEGLETFWIQYVVAYDGQEQRSLFRTFRDNLRGYMASGSEAAAGAQLLFKEWWEELRGDEGVVAGAKAAGIGVAVLGLLAALIFGIIKLRRFVLKFALFGWLARKLGRKGDGNAVVFYHEMQRLLARQGLVRQPFQTPVEFASETGIPEVAEITAVYNRVRFGGETLSESERAAIEAELETIKSL